MKTWFFIFGLISHFCFAAVQESTLSSLASHPQNATLSKLTEEQMTLFASTMHQKPLRVMSYNMLFNLPFAEQHLPPEHHWKERIHRIEELTAFIKPDVLASQELQADQIDDLMQTFGSQYNYYGIGRRDGKKQGEIEAIFYNIARLELLATKTLYISATPEKLSATPQGKKRTVTACKFYDRQTEKTFLVLNTHLTFGDAESREYEAKFIGKLVEMIPENIPTLLMGDFNTFPFRPELDLPFYDGDKILHHLMGSSLKDAREITLGGHWGPISTSNYCPEKKQNFIKVGTDGVILDHILVNRRVKVLYHFIEKAKVDGHFPSDHLPVIADVVID